MRALYPPPVHLRQSPAAVEMALGTYRRGLARFARPVLEQAWQKVCEVNSFWVWPKISDLVQTCKHFEREARKAEGGPSYDQRVEQATALAYAYTRRFMQTSQLASRARA